MGIFFNPELTRNAEAPSVDAVLLLQRQLLAATQLHVEHAAREPMDDPVVVAHNRTARFSAELRR